MGWESIPEDRARRLYERGGYFESGFWVAELLGLSGGIAMKLLIFLKEVYKDWRKKAIFEFKNK